MSRTLLSPVLVSLLLSAPVFAWDGKSVEGSMLNAQVRTLITEKGMAALEAARFECLNTDSEKPCVWVDPGADISGAFKITERSKDDSGNLCRTYTHRLFNRGGVPIRVSNAKKNLAFINVVCYINHAWEVILKSGSVNPAPSQTPGSLTSANSNATNSPTPPPLEPSGPTGVEHRAKYRDMTEPKALGEILDGIKLYKQYLDGEKNNTFRSGVRDQMYGWLESLREQMTSLNKTMALDQLTILLQSVDTDAAKIKVIEILKPRLVLIGDANTQKTEINKILQLLQTKQNRNRVRDAFKRLPTAAT